jgi:hypothetical protein
MAEAPPSPARTELEELLENLIPAVRSVDVRDAAKASAALNQVHPLASKAMRRVRELCAVGVREGWLVPKPAGPNCSFGRLAKDMDGYAVDCVLMSGKALGHTHTNGEINICFAWEGDDPRFDGHPAGWVVFPPGSHHVPTVTNGTMLFVYFLPGGAVVWDKPTKG